MARASLLTSNFTGGELSPAIALGRVDIQKYNNGVRRLENLVLTVQGGVKRRPGSRFISEVKDSTKATRLVEFVYSRGQAYVIEMGEGYLRFFKDRQTILSGGLPYEVASPYFSVQLQDVGYVQKSDTAFFVHEANYPHRLQRYADNQWAFAPVVLLTPPAEEQGHYPAFTLTLSSTVPGAATATASGAAFLVSDVRCGIIYGGGTAIITGFTSTSVVSLDIVTPFPTSVLPSGDWNIDGSPIVTLYPSSNGNVGDVISVTSGSAFAEAQKTVVSGLGTSTEATTLEVTAHGYSTGNTIVLNGSGSVDGTYVISVVDADHFNIPPALGVGMTLPGATPKVWRMGNNPGGEWLRTEDVGKLLNMNGGILEIVQYVSASTANVRVLQQMAAPIAAAATTWQMVSNAWNGKKGFPRSVTISKQRLMFGGSRGYPQHLWASEVQGYLNFLFGTADDQAFRFELDGPRNSPIKHLVPSRELLVLTESDEMSLKGGQEKAISATNIQKTDQSTMGSSSVRPVKIANESVFVTASGKKVAASGYRFDIDGFASPDRTVFAAHITGDGVTQMAYQKDPDSILYAVRTDGQLAVCAYDVEQEVTGWGRWITQGAFESVAVVPTDTAEEAYAVVNRTVDGATKRYVEVFDPDMLVDCGITGSDPVGKATWNGLDHLEGMQVQAWADGTYQGTFTVAGGEITLPRDALEVQIGLGFTCLVEMLQVEVGGNGTTAQGSQVHVNEVIIRVLDTSAAYINGQPVEFRKFGDELLDLPPPLYSGDVRRTTLSDSIFTTQQVITQPLPMPFHLLDVIRRTTVNDG